MRAGVTLSRVKNTVGPTLRRFWAPVALTIALTITLIEIVETDFHSRTDLVRIAWALFPGILIALDTILLWERTHQVKQGTNTRIDPEFMANFIALPTACLVVALNYLMLRNLNLVSLSRQAAISLFLLLSFFVIPHFRREGSLEMYIVRMFAHAVVTILFSGIMFLGLSAIVFAESSLFSLNVSQRVYIDIWLVNAGIIAPFLFMGGIPRGTVQANPEEYPKVLKNLVLFVVTPLLTAYAGVLYLYFAKILITRQWPVGLVSHLVLWYSLVSVATLLFLSPIRPENKWASEFSRVFPKVMIPLLLMMFASVAIRIQHYGITENRYYVLVLGLWVLGSMIYLISAKAARAIVLPASLAMVVILSVFGPWSSFSVSKWSQNRRLESLLTKHGMLQHGAIVPASEAVPPSDRQEIAEILSYFDRNHNLTDVRVLPQGFSMADFEKVFGFEPSHGVPDKSTMYVTYESPIQPVDIGGFQYLFDLGRASASSSSPIRLSRGDIAIEYDEDNKRLTVYLGGDPEWKISLNDYVGSLKPIYEGGSLPRFDPEDMVLDAETTRLRIKLVITALGAEVPTEGNTKTRIDHLWFYVLVGEK